MFFPLSQVLLAAVALVPRSLPSPQDLLREFLLSDPADLQRGTIAGDLDRDGVLDIAFTGDDLEGPGGAGVVVVLSGRDGSLIWRARGSTTSLFGRQVARIGDLDLDGHDDLAIAAPGSARIKVLSGRDKSVLLDLKNGWIGHWVSAAGDLDGDGVPDLWTDYVTTRVAAYSGATGQQIRLCRPSTGQWTYARPDLADDLDGDGIREVLVTDGYHIGDGSGGRGGGLWVFSGATGDLLMEWLGTEDAAGTGTQAVRIASLGDIGGDGRADFGLSYLDKVQGQGVLNHLDLYEGLGQPGPALTPAEYAYEFGPAGDLDLDGRSEFFHGAGPNWAFDLASGRTTQTLYRFRGDRPLYHAQGGADLDGDGRPNLLLSQFETSVNQGRVLDHALRPLQLWNSTSPGAGGPLTLEVGGLSPFGRVRISRIDPEDGRILQGIAEGRGDAAGRFLAHLPLPHSPGTVWTFVAHGVVGSTGPRGIAHSNRETVLL